MVTVGGWWWWWAKPLQTLSQGVVLTLRSLLALSLTILLMQSGYITRFSVLDLALTALLYLSSGHVVKI